MNLLYKWMRSSSTGGYALLMSLHLLSRADSYNSVNKNIIALALSSVDSQCRFHFFTSNLSVSLHQVLVRVNH